MKRLYLLSMITLMMAVAILPLNVKAQVSVWNGTAVTWAHGSGTQNDPYLIENAQNLAYLCNGVGNGYTYSNKYFRLTTDINLASIAWTPIGDATHSFCGKFDGNNHFINNMVISGSFTCKGLFGSTGNGFSCENLTINITITSTGGSSGGIVGTAFGPFNISNCHVQGSIKGSCSGGIMGGLSGATSYNYSGSQIYNCYNEASITSTGTSGVSSTSAISSAGGIVGSLTCSSVLLNKCYNKGSISASSTSSVSQTHAQSGGIVGKINYSNNGNSWYNQNRIVNCYNTGSVSSLAQYNNPYATTTPYPKACAYSGGIVGNMVTKSGNNADYNTISNCYNTGNLSATYYSNHPEAEELKGGIVAKYTSSYVHILNCYYLSTCGGTNSGGSSKTASQMKASSFPTVLNTDSVVFVKDVTPNINQGYPVFGSVRTLNANNISMTTATLNGDYQLPYNVDAHGFEYKKTSESNYTTVNIADSSAISHTLTNLQVGTQYTYRFFVQKDGVYYRGADKTFNTIQCTLTAHINSSSNTLCDGDTVFYTAMATSSTPTIYHYVWSTGDSLNSIPVTDGATYTVTVTDAYGCTSVATRTISVNQPVISNLTYSMCQGESYNFYGQNITAAGTYTHTLQTINGCDSVLTLTVTLKALPPTAITGTTSFCEGETTTLTATGGVSYVWSNGSAENSISVNQSGVYTVTATNAEGCSATANVTVTVNPLPNVSISGNNSFCQGDNVTLIATGANTYLWSNASSNAAITVSNAGTYTVTGTDANGCTNTATKTVTVNPTYNIPLTHSMCEGESYNFYGQNIISAGTYTHTMQTVNGCDSVLTLTVTLKALPPTAITGNTTLCEGESTTLVATGGVSYAWSNGGTSNSTTVNQSGVYTVIATNAEGCSATANVTVTVNPLPTITIGGSTTVCAGSSTTLTATGANTYSWSTGDNTASVTINAFGVYTVTGTSAEGCSNTSEVTVLISQLPVITIAGETDICAGESTTLTANGGETYLWSDGTTNNNLTVSTAGTYQVIGYNAAGCNAMASATVNVWQPTTSEFSISTPDSCYTWNAESYCTSGDYTQTLQTVHGCDSVVTMHLTITVGIDDHHLGTSMTVYPNPTTGMVNVECTMNNTQAEKVEFQLFDAFGRLLRKTDGVETQNFASLQTARIDLSHCAAGVYFVKAVADGCVIAVRKVIKN